MDAAVYIGSTNPWEWLVISLSYFYAAKIKIMKPDKPLLQSIRLLDQVWERIRYLHYSHSTEKTYLYWVRFLSVGMGWSIRATWGLKKS